MKTVKVLLSSRERKAMFHAVRVMKDTRRMNTTNVSDDRIEEMLDDLDDGGIWNPCFIVIPEKENFFFRLLLNSVSNSNRFGENHILKMIKDRVEYITNRTNGYKPKEYNGSGWEDKRNIVLNRDNGKCSECGMGKTEHEEKYGTGLHIHHIIPKSKFTTLERANEKHNLITLCVSCHVSKHKNRTNPTPIKQ